MRICVVGTGYVGLVAGAGFSDSGNHVICVDIDENKIKRLNEGHIPIYEPGLEELILRNREANRITFTSQPGPAIEKSKVIFIAVGTPQDEDGSADLKYVLKAVETVRDHVKEPSTVVLKSTVPVGTADKVKAILKEAKVHVEVVSNPEFLKEGKALDDFMRPERVIIGTDSHEARELMADLYAPYVRSGNPILFMNNRSAELAKYAANSFLAMKISFINDLAQLCEKTGAEIHDVRQVLVTDSRIGRKFLYPGCGYGGSCFPKDVSATIKLGQSVNFPLRIFEAVHSANERQKQVVFEKVARHFGDSLKGKSIAIWGLSFKPLTDDMREAPAVSLIESLLSAGCKVQAYDPVAGKEASRLFGSSISVFENAYDAIKSADALAIMTEWNEFRSPDFELIKESLSEPVIIDGRNIYNPKSLAKAGFTYYCIGIPDPI